MREVEVEFVHRRPRSPVRMRGFVAALVEITAPDLASITIPDSVTSIGSSALSDCIHLASIAIPDSVISIGDGAFDSCAKLNSVTIGNRVNSIGWSAFDSCALTQVTIPDSVTSIGEGAFSSCTNLTSLTIPGGVTNIGSGAFDSCTSLSAIAVNATNSFFLSVDGVLFDKSMATLLQYPAGKAGNYVVPNSVTSIASFAFCGCRSLSSVLIPSGVTSIGRAAFSSCAILTNVTVPDSVTSIGDGGLELCTSLASVIIGTSVASIGDQAFFRCTNLAGVFFKGDAPFLEGISVFDYAYQATVYYLAGTTGWGSTYGGRPTALWIQQVQPSISGVGVRTNRFGFTINGTSNLVIVVEASTNLGNPAWVPLQTNILSGSSSYFSDPQWTDYSRRFYRVRSP